MLVSPLLETRDFLLDDVIIHLALVPVQTPLFESVCLHFSLQFPKYLISAKKLDISPGRTSLPRPGPPRPRILSSLLLYARVQHEGPPEA